MSPLSSVTCRHRRVALRQVDRIAVRPSRADFQYAGPQRVRCQRCQAVTTALGFQRRHHSALISAASSTVSATVAGTSATRTSIVGKLADGRTSQ